MVRARRDHEVSWIECLKSEASSWRRLNAAHSAVIARLDWATSTPGCSFVMREGAAYWMPLSRSMTAVARRRDRVSLSILIGQPLCPSFGVAVSGVSRLKRLWSRFSATNRQRFWPRVSERYLRVWQCRFAAQGSEFGEGRLVPSRFRLRCRPPFSAGCSFLSAPEGRLGFRPGHSGVEQDRQTLKAARASSALQGHPR
jgi:hypothetical protein